MYSVMFMTLPAIKQLWNKLSQIVLNLKEEVESNAASNPVPEAKKKVKKEQLTKAQKRKMLDRIGKWMKFYFIAKIPCLLHAYFYRLSLSIHICYLSRTVFHNLNRLSEIQFR